LLFKSGQGCRVGVGLVGKEDLKRVLEPHLTPVAAH
jgi:hypothetical protein